MMTTETSQTERDAEKIRIAYGARYNHGGRRGELMAISELVDSLDLTHERLTAAIRHLGRTDDDFVAIPNSRQGDLTENDRRHQVVIGNQFRHIIFWQ